MILIKGDGDKSEVIKEKLRTGEWVAKDITLLDGFAIVNWGVKLHTRLVALQPDASMQFIQWIIEESTCRPFLAFKQLIVMTMANSEHVEIFKELENIIRERNSSFKEIVLTVYGDDDIGELRLEEV